MTITKEGVLASFYTVNKAPIKHLKVYFSPKQAGSGDPSPSNVRPITGWTGCRLHRTGKNIFPNENGNLALLDLKAGTVITASTSPNTGGYFRGQNESGEHVTPIVWLNKTDESGRKATAPYTLPENISTGLIFLSVGVSAAQITLDGSTSYEPYSGITIPVDWSNDIGTIYGGYVDLVTGELIQTHKCFDFSDIDILLNSDGLRAGCPNFAQKYGVKAPAYNNVYANSMAEKYKLVKSNITTPQQWDYFISSGSSGGVLIIFTYGEQPTGKLICELATPITHQLTSTQLQTFIGQNNIWSNADRVEVEYDLAESNEELYKRRNIILNSAPHIEIASGTIATFNTDMIAPIKSAKFYFNPIQEGSGDPSPDNVRDISGWNGINIYKTNKNLLGVATIVRYSPNVSEKVWGVADWNSRNIPDGSLILQPGTYTLSIGITSGNTPIEWRVKNAAGYIDHAYSGYLSRTFTITKAEPILIYIATKSSDNAFLDNSVILEYGSSKTIYQEALGSTVSINWTLTAGTIYGGYIDLINGNLYQTHKYVTLEDDTKWITANGYFGYTVTFKDRKTGERYNFLCNSFPVNPDTISGTPYMKWGSADATVITVQPNGSSITINNLKTMVQNREISICYPLTNPILITTLTPQQLKTLKGANNIWSNANGPVEISYWTH